jgi:hypothetical protein
VDHSLDDLLEGLLPKGMDTLLEGVLGESMPRVGSGGQYGIVASGRFRGALTADILSFTQNNKLDAALVLTEGDTTRVLYFHAGTLIGATSSVLFERIGRLLYRAGAVTHEASDILIDIEDQQGAAALLDWVPEPTLAWAAERRVWEVVAGLYVAGAGHFVLVEGLARLDRALTSELDPTQVALEGMRRHDQWRNRSAGGAAAKPTTSSYTFPVVPPVVLDPRAAHPVKRLA